MTSVQSGYMYIIIFVVTSAPRLQAAENPESYEAAATKTQQDQMLQSLDAQERRRMHRQSTQQHLRQARDAEQRGLAEQRTAAEQRERAMQVQQQELAQQRRALNENVTKSRSTHNHLRAAARQGVSRQQRSATELLRALDEENKPHAHDSDDSNSPGVGSVLGAAIGVASGNQPSELKSPTNKPLPDMEKSETATMIAVRDGASASAKIISQAFEATRKIKKKTDRVTKPINSAARTLAPAIKGDPIVSDNPLVNDIRWLAQRINREDGDRARQDANGWIIESGLYGSLFTNGGNIVAAIDSSIENMTEEKDRFNRLSSECEALDTLVRALNVADHLHIKRVARDFSTLKYLDMEARKDALVELGRCKSNSEYAQVELDRAIQLMKNSRQRIIRDQRLTVPLP